MFGRFKLPVWTLPLAIAVLVAVLGVWGHARLRETIENGLQAQLTATLKANVTALGIWSMNQTRLATALAEDPEVRTLAVRMLENPRAAHRDFQPMPDWERFLAELKPRLPQLGYEVAQLVATNFQVVATSQRLQGPGNLMVSDAHTNKFAQLFATGQPVIITPFKPELLEQRRLARNLSVRLRTNSPPRLNHAAALNAGRPRRGDISLMQVAAPVRNAAHEVVGALALIIDPDKEFSRILSVARSGESGETYAFDQTGLMISHSRFDDQLRRIGLLDPTNATSALNLRLHDPGGDLTRGYLNTDSEVSARPLIRLVASAVDGEDEVDVTPSRDYRGVPVVGASCWLPEYGFGVATQIDADEAYRSLRVLQLVFVVLILFLLLCATALFVFSCANLAWRRRLNEAELKLKQLGQYTLEEKIGEGGMGVVYRARHALMRRDTAVKLLSAGLADPAAVARFEREVCLTCQLTHPNTIQVYDYGHTPDGIFYYAMEFLRGMNLHDLVARHGPLPEGRVVHILAQVCDSLAEAHALGLIHRDIKPANVFLCRRGGMADFVKVLDFGLIHEFRAAAGPGVKPVGGPVIEGTPLFLPPEAINGMGAVDPRSDLYSVGALGYYLLTGQYIFEANNVAEVYDKQITVLPMPPSQRTGQPVSREMEELLLRCLEKDPMQRPHSAQELVAALRATPWAAVWTPELRAAWWEAWENPAPATESVRMFDAPMPTVRIDLATRME